MKFILNKRIQYYTKEASKWLRLVAIALFIICSIIFLKYKLVCEVSISGEKIGYIENKSLFDNQIQELLNQSGINNIAFVDLPNIPEYKLVLISNKQKIDNADVFNKVKETAKITYEYYSITVNGKQESIVNSLEEAESLVAKMKEKYDESISCTIGINKVYSEDNSKYTPVEIATAEKKVTTELQNIKSKSVNGIYLAQKPISGVITSRFGDRESIRSFPHNGLDIAAPYGTKIKSATSGKVTTSGEVGSYGNLVVVDCGNGVQIYYGHCSKLLVNVGDKVNAGDIIAEVGSTGNSTGNHLHFEIKINGVSVNPQNYIYN